MSGLQLTNVIKRYGATQVIHGVDLTIEDGEFCVFVGPSGCGKSTLLRMVAGLEETTEGRIAIGGRDVTRTDPAERGVAMVFQTYALYPHMTVEENMGFGLRMTGHPKAEIRAKVAEASRILKLDDYLARKPKALSGGQRQRVAIGRAIVRDPKIFLFDEPLSNLDAELRVAMRKELSALRHEIGGTMIYVTHDQTEAMTLADRIVVMRLGYLEQVGTPLDLYNRPANLFVAGFIGSPKMNFIEGMVAAGGAEGSTSVLVGTNGIELPFTIPASPGDRVTLGVRPEHLDVSGAGAGDFDVKVDLSEQLGGETYFYATPQVGEGMPQVTVHRLGQQLLARGDLLGLKLRPAQVHVFDSNGTTIHHGVGDT